MLWLVGQLFLSLLHNNWTIGYVESTSANLTIHPGENAIQCVGELQATTGESYAALSAVIQNYLTGQASLVEALAGPNVTSYPLLSPAMMGLSLNVRMPPFDEQLITSVKFNSMSLIPSMVDKQVQLAASIDIQINSPLGRNSPLHIQTMDMSVFLLFENASVGMLNVSGVPVQQRDARTYSARFDNETLVLTETGATYAKFTQAFIQASAAHPISFRLVGVASIVGSFALGPLQVEGILVENDVSLVGLNGFNDVRVDGISVDGEEGNMLRLSINATINNPGVTDVQLQNFSLHMAEGVNGTILGQVPIERLAVKPGSNSVALKGSVPCRWSTVPI